MTSIAPLSVPQCTEQEVRDILDKHRIEPPALVGFRGYYRDSMGRVGANDRGIYDDAIALLTPTAFVTFNANCDPSIVTPGRAVLNTGVWKYKVGIHGLNRPASQRYKALVQADVVTVTRDAAGPDTGFFGINIHRGKADSTSSIGCQTIVPQQWASFIGLVESEMQRHGARTIPYILIDR